MSLPSTRTTKLSRPFDASIGIVATTILEVRSFNKVEHLRFDELSDAKHVSSFYFMFPRPHSIIHGQRPLVDIRRLAFSSCLPVVGKSNERSEPPVDHLSDAGVATSIQRSQPLTLWSR